jgi:ADP-ribosylglycohydrolase
VLQCINEFLPVKELAGGLIEMPVLRQFGLVENEKVDHFLATAFGAKREPPNTNATEQLEGQPVGKLTNKRARDLAIQGAVLQATAVAIATKGNHDTAHFLRILTATLAHFEGLGQDTTVYKKALAEICDGISKSVPPIKMADILGNGIKPQEAVPMALYCYLANPGSFEQAVEAAVFLGGDTDTIASMTGAISGAALSEKAIPERWLKRVTEAVYTPDKIREIARELYRKGLGQDFRTR